MNITREGLQQRAKTLEKPIGQRLRVTLVPPLVGFWVSIALMGLLRLGYSEVLGEPPVLFGAFIGGLVTYIVLQVGRRAERHHQGLTLMLRLYDLQKALTVAPPEKFDQMQQRIEDLEAVVIPEE